MTSRRSPRKDQLLALVLKLDCISDFGPTTDLILRELQRRPGELAARLWDRRGGGEAS